MKKREFNPLYSGIEDIEGFGVFYNKRGEYSTMFKIENNIEIFSGNTEIYDEYVRFISSILRMLGDGYAFQKHDVFKKKTYKKNIGKGFLSKSYFKHFEGREYINIETYITITQESKKNAFLKYDKKKWKEFIDKAKKIEGLFLLNSIQYRRMEGEEIKEFLYRYFTMHFSEEVLTLDNVKGGEDYIQIGKKIIKNISVVDIDEVNLPETIEPYRTETINGNEMPIDIMGFLAEVKGADTIIYSQNIIIPNQRLEYSRLVKKKNRHSSLPDPSNNLAANDIERVQNNIARENSLLLYAHYNISIYAEEDIKKVCNSIENSLEKVGITVSKNSYNQFELFLNNMPGCSFLIKKYDRFLTLQEVAACLMYKEKITLDEESPLRIYFTNRWGIPKSIDITGKEGKKKLTENSNFFCLGPSGSGKSFNINSIVRQLYEQNTDILIIDTGNSYEGLCQYIGGKYITYTEEKPITMNPFRFSKEEYNLEKRDFLENLIIQLWKGSGGEQTTAAEAKIIRDIIALYYSKYFTETEDIKELSFNSFYEFAIKEIPNLSMRVKIEFDIDEFKYILNDFYKGGRFERVLNDEVDKTLFDETFIVFEVDAIKENKILFPIVTLIIMDLFIQKMRIKKNRKALIIEEAWKAIASPNMAEYIKYLYKTVRKFWGLIGLVTQEVEDIISSDIVKNAIINNSQVIMLLDQSKFKERYNEVKELLGLSEIECKKIWSINSLDNKEGRNFFKEVYIKRGGHGDVFGVEESNQSYMAYTTERVEKEGLKLYIKKEGNIEKAIEVFCQDWEKSGERFAIDFVKNNIQS